MAGSSATSRAAFTARQYYDRLRASQRPARRRGLAAARFRLLLAVGEATYGAVESMRAQFVLSEMWIGLRRNVTMTIAVIVTVAISLALFGLGLTIRSQVDAMKSKWFDKIEVSIFLCTQSSSTPACEGSGPATEKQQGNIRQTLTSMPEVQRVYYESQAEAWQRFQQQFEGSPLLKSTDKRDLPDSFRVKLQDPRDYAVVANAVRGRPGVDQVINQQEVLQRFFSVLNGLRNAALFIALALVIAGTLLISNTIRIAAYNRRRETGIMRLVGASKFYIQLPFLLEGALAGLVGGLFAAGSLLGVKVFFIDSIAQTFPNIGFVGWGAIVRIILLQLVAGVLLCGLASFVTLRRYLRV